MINNLASRWTKEETELLSKNLENENYEELCDLLPGRSKASIKAKQRRLNKDKIPTNIVLGMFKYYLEGEPEGQILLKLKAAGHNYTLNEIALNLKQTRAEFSEKFKDYAEERKIRPRFKVPTLDQLRLFIELSKSGDEVALRKVITNG